MSGYHWGALFILVWAGACGGATIIDAAESEGQGGGGGNDGTGGGVAAPTLCERACSSLEDCDAGRDHCVTECEGRLQKGCGEAYREWIECALDRAGTLCGDLSKVGCSIQEYMSCQPSPPGELGCNDGPDGCSCSVFVSPGIVLEQRCDASGQCGCYSGGEGPPVGTCPGEIFECSYVDNCCAGIFYL